MADEHELNPFGDHQAGHPEGLVIPPDGGEAVWLLDELIVFKAGGVETGERVGFAEVTARPGGGPPLHVHRMQIEASYVLEGALTVRIDRSTHKASPGAFLLIPPDSPHTYRVDSKEPAKLLTIYSPAGMLRYFKEVGQVAPVKTLPPDEHIPDIERYVERGIRYFLEILGPPI